MSTGEESVAMYIFDTTSNRKAFSEFEYYKNNKRWYVTHQSYDELIKLRSTFDLANYIYMLPV